jgi:diaminopropionate ammonia-lyase
MRLLANAPHGDPAIIAGESAIAGLAGLMAAVRRTETRAVLGLDANSRVLLIGSEGATDPDIYAAIVGTLPTR